LILDSVPERAYDDIARLLATSLAVPITMVNLLDAQRDWFKSCVGAQHAIAYSHIVLRAFFNSTRDFIVAEDTLEDERFDDHPLVVVLPFIWLYAAARLAMRGRTVGTLCVYEVRPRWLSPVQLDHLQTMASAAIELCSQREMATRHSSAR
jgi:GAF domain-containing protein